MDCVPPAPEAPSMILIYNHAFAQMASTRTTSEFASRQPLHRSHATQASTSTQIQVVLVVLVGVSNAQVPKNVQDALNSMSP